MVPIVPLQVCETCRGFFCSQGDNELAALDLGSEILLQECLDGVAGRQAPHTAIGLDERNAAVADADEERAFRLFDLLECAIRAELDNGPDLLIGLECVNFKEMFQEKVIDYFLADYAKGWTPNPCIACNRYVKFEGLLQKAMELGAEYVATGHYARIGQDETGRYVLKKGIDTHKDQSYALYHLNQQSLAHFLMPLGDYTKVETRELAERYKLPVAHKPDSQEICFVPHDDYKAYLRAKNPACLHPGDIVDTEGHVLGHHEGVPLYTIGQRKGLGIAHPEPLYVVDLDMAHDRVIVGGAKDVYADGLIAGDLNWIAIDALEAPIAVTAKVRYGRREGRAHVEPLAGGKVKVRFEEPQRAMTPGQSVVFYDGDTVVGGGIIEKALRKGEEV